MGTKVHCSTGAEPEPDWQMVGCCSDLHVKLPTNELHWSQKSLIIAFGTRFGHLGPISVEPPPPKKPYLVTVRGIKA